MKEEIKSSQALIKELNKLGTPVEFILEKQGSEGYVMRYRVNGNITADKTHYRSPLAARREIAQLLVDYYTEKKVPDNAIPETVSNDAAFQACREAATLQERLKPYNGKITFHSTILDNALSFQIKEKRSDFTGEAGSFEKLTDIFKNYEKYCKPIPATTQAEFDD
jgi:hypothetical protein